MRPSVRCLNSKQPYEMVLFNALIPILFSMSQQIKKCKRRNPKHLIPRRCVMHTVIICSFRDNDSNCRIVTVLNNSIIIGNRCALTVFDFNQDILCTWIIDNNINLFILPSTAIVSNRCCLLIIESSNMLINRCDSSISTAFRIAASAI